MHAQSCSLFPNVACASDFSLLVIVPTSLVWFFYTAFQFHLRFQLFARILHFVLELHVFHIDIINSSQLTNIVELRLFKSPVLFSLF